MPYPSFEALSGRGVQLDIGAFVVRVAVRHPHAADHFTRLYYDWQFSEAPGGHFDVVIEGGTGVRRWVRRQARLIVNGHEPFLPLPADLAGPLVEWGLNWSIGQRSCRWLVIHAAVVERNGRAMIMPGRSGSGKSTLCAELTFRGWRLLSDEFALIDPESGLLRPCPRPISLKNASIEIVRRRHPEVETSQERTDVEGARFVHARPPAESVRRAHEPALPRWLVFPKYTAGHRTELEPVARARALVELADQSFNYNYLGARGFECLVNLMRSVDTYAFEYSDLDEAVDCFAALSSG